MKRRREDERRGKEEQATDKNLTTLSWQVGKKQEKWVKIIRKQDPHQNLNIPTSWVRNMYLSRDNNLKQQKKCYHGQDQAN